MQAAKDRAKAFDDARPENQQPLDRELSILLTEMRKCRGR